MRRIFLLYIICLSLPTVLLSQVKDTTNTKAKNIIWYVPSKAKHINGIALGLCNLPNDYKQTINGISFELLGAGYVVPFILAAPDDEGYLPKSRHNLKNNGLVLGLTLYSGQINGIGVSPLIGANYDLNGFSFSTINITVFKANGLMTGVVNASDIVNGIQLGLLNVTDEQNGVQIGLVNIAKDLRGFQFGIWNVNDKRSLPFINWQFGPAKQK